MKRFFAAPFCILTTFCVLLTIGTLKAEADTVNLYLASVGGQSSDGYYVYPYNLSINGNSNLTPLMCISFTQEINIGDSWIATVESVTGSAEEEAAWLLNDANLNPGNLVDDQWAAWELFDPGLTGPDQAGISAQLTGAQSGIASLNFADFEVYVPVAGSQAQSTGDYPQIFLGEATPGGARFSNTPTPEPGSLILFSTGLLGLMVVLYRRRLFA